MAEVVYAWGPGGSCVVIAIAPQQCGRCHTMRSLFVNDKRTTEWGGTVCGTCWLELPEPEKQRQELVEKTA